MLAPDPESVTEPPRQMLWSRPAETTGNGFTTTVVVPVQTFPRLSVAVTVIGKLPAVGAGTFVTF